MKTDDLIQSLVEDLTPSPRGLLARRTALGLALGAVVALALVGLVLGFNPDLPGAMSLAAFWMKWGYSLSLGLIAIVALARLARPESGPPRLLWLLAVPVLAVAAVAGVELAGAPRRMWAPLWLGQSWMVCPWLVLGLAAPIFAGLLWSFRRFAPTQLRAAGAAAGVSAGAFAASVYCLHCPEMSAPFVLTWYSLGIAMAGGLGALLGPRLLRW